ncbi:MAG: O-antigen ligase family protein [Desulfotomaculaceae bacterium]|nr:O-antigen ligase family protein [Desulfotomaculaceae bacterium]
MRFEPALCDILFVLAGAAWLIDRFIHGKGVPLESKDWLLLGFLLTGWIGVAYAPSIPESVRFAGITTYLAVFYYIIRQASKDISLRNIMISFYLASALITVVLVWIAIAGSPLWQLPADSLLTYRTRPIALFKSPNVAGAFIVPAALYFLWRSLQYVRPAGLAALYLISECAVFLTMSRGALMSLGLGCLIIFLLTPSTWRKRFTLMVLSVLVVELLSFVLAFYPATVVGELDRVFPHMPLFRYVVTEKSLPPAGMLAIYPQGVVKDYDRGGRAYAWKAGLEIIKEQPLLGRGPGSFESLSPAIEEKLGAKIITPSAHNLYIRVMAENGIIGFALLLVFFIYAWRNARYKGDNLWIKAALVALLVDAFFIDSLHFRHLWLLLALL